MQAAKAATVGPSHRRAVRNNITLVTSEIATSARRAESRALTENARPIHMATPKIHMANGGLAKNSDLGG